MATTGYTQVSTYKGRNILGLLSIWRDRLVCLMLCVLTFGLGLAHSILSPLWFDEIWTMRIALLPSWGSVFRATQTIDLNPPLNFFLVHGVSPLLGTREFAGRLPSVIGYTLAVCGLFWLLRQHIPTWFAAFGAVMLLVDKKIFYYATEARPYALLLGFSVLAAAAYGDLLRSRHPARARMLLALSIAGMLLSHVFAVFTASALLLAELVRSLRTRRVDWPTWIALILPLMCFALYPPLLGFHATLHYPPENRPSLHAAFGTYKGMFASPLILPLLCCGIALLLFRSFPWRPPAVTFRAYLRPRPEELLLFASLLVTPVTIAVLLLITHPESGFFDRYGIVFVIPAIVLLTTLIAWRSQNAPRGGRILFFALVVVLLVQERNTPRRLKQALQSGISHPSFNFTSSGVENIDPDLPLVANDFSQFMEADDRLSDAVLRRYFYLADSSVARRLTRTDGVEYLVDLQKPFHMRGKVSLLQPFIAEHKRFLVLGDATNSTSWVIRWAKEQNAKVESLGSYQFAGKMLPLWRVTLLGDANASSKPQEMPEMK